MPSSPRIRLAVVLLLLAAVPTFAQTPAKGPPTQEEIQKMLEAKAYRPALQAIAQIMPAVVAGKAPGYDRFTLLMIRGECLIQLKDPATAIIAYEQAVAAAASLQQDEASRSMLLLLKKSPGMVYTPRSGDKTPIDITNPVDRKRAMAALLADELPALTARVDEALKATSLPPIFALGPALRDMHAIEQVSTGGATRTAALTQSLGDRVYELTDAELARVDEQVKAIQRAAARVLDTAGGNFQMINGELRWVPAQGSTGLTSDNRAALRDAIAYLAKITQTCDDLAALAQHYERDGKRWSALAKRSRGIADFATVVYDHE